MFVDARILKFSKPAAVTLSKKNIFDNDNQTHYSVTHADRH